MFRFILCKIRNKKWMIISLLLGNLLMVAIAAAGPMYSQAALQRMLTSNLSSYLVESNKYPGTIVAAYDCTTFGKMSESAYVKVDEGAQLLEELVDELEVPVLESGFHYSKSNLVAKHEIDIDDNNDNLRLKLVGYSDFAAHVEFIQGEIYSAEVQDNVIEVVVNENTFVESKMMLGEILTLPSIKDADGNAYSLKVVGVFEPADPQELCWITNPGSWESVCMMDADLFREVFISMELKNVNYNAEWFSILDYTAIRGDQAENYLEAIYRAGEKYDELNMKSLSVYFQSILEEFVPQGKKLDTTIGVLQLPIFVLLASFIFMVSRQMLEMEQNEISIYKSRGANKGQILSMYLLQSVLIGLVSLAAGIPLGIFVCKVLGASNSFLEFVKRTGLPVEICPKALLFAGGAVIFSIGTMVLPVIKYANVNIVDHKRKKNRAAKHSLWQMLCVDVILLGISLYGLYQFNERRDYLAQQVLEGASLDPLLYICSSLFMMGAALLVLRIFPWIVRLIFWLGKRWWSPALYSSFLRIIRTRSNQGFMMVFLILTVAMGIYDAQAARTINANAQERIQYITGADLVLREEWTDNADAVAGDATGTLELTYLEPSFEKYEEMEGVELATKVLVSNNVNVSVENGKLKNVMLMGIHTKEFGQVAWFKESLLPAHYHEYLNAISQNAQAILVSSNFRDLYGYEVGDVLNYSTDNNSTLRGIIYGFVDYWPSYAPVVKKMGSDGLYQETDHFLIVAHLAQIQAAWGVTPYQVWIKTEDSSQFIYDYAEESGTRYMLFEDTSAELIELKNDPIFQGTNGVLTIGFICILVLCIMGFLIYWILSIQSRTLQFGIFRAMGMSMGEVFAMLLNEQLFISGVSIGAGIGVGILTSRLFVPLIQIAYSSADQVLPLEIISESSDYVRLFAVIGAAILLCLGILGWLISRIRISQALKLGED